MKIKTIYLSTFMGFVGGTYLTMVYFLSVFSSNDSGTQIFRDTSLNYMLLYFIINCCLMLLTALFIRAQKIKIAKFSASILFISVMAGMFFPTLRITLWIGIIAGGFVPYLGLLPTGLFLWGTVSPLFFLFKKEINPVTYEIGKSELS